MSALRRSCFLAAATALAGPALVAQAQATSSSTSSAERAPAVTPTPASGALPAAPRIVMFSGTGIVVFSGPADVGDPAAGLKPNAAPRADEGPAERAGKEVGPGQSGEPESDGGTW
jgi:hypothetical protein